MFDPARSPRLRPDATTRDAECPPRTLVLGLGNALLGDDSVGLRVVQHVQSHLEFHPDIDVDEDTGGGLRLMERLIGYDRAVLVDAQCSGGEPGTVDVLPVDVIPTQHSHSAHDVNLRMALELGRRAGARLPATDAIRLVTIEILPAWTFSEECTPAVEASIGHATQTVLALLTAWR